MDTNPITTLKNRLAKICIEIEFHGNIPWIYLYSVNGVRVRREDFTANHGFNIAWYPIHREEPIRLAEDPKEIIALIRKYVRESKLIQIIKDDEETGLYQKPE
jgi:hypothetical protein